MIDQEKLEAFESQKATQAAKPFSLESLDTAQLLSLREAIEARLPARRLSELDLEKETVVQMMQARATLATLLASGEDPHKVAPTLNALTTLLAQLSKLQADLYSSERVKAMESALIATMQSQPDEVKAKFFDTYERLYAAERGK